MAISNKISPTAVSLLVALLATQAANAQSRQEKYQATSWGPLTLTLNGTDLTGEFPKHDGKVYLKKVQGERNHYYGTWVQPKSDQRCDTAKYGSYYWGNVGMTFPGNNSFSALWGYCTDIPERKWTDR